MCVERERGWEKGGRRVKGVKRHTHTQTRTHAHTHTLTHTHTHTHTHTLTHSHTHSLTHTRRAGKLKGLMETAKEKGARRFREAQQKRMNEHSKQAGSN